MLSGRLFWLLLSSFQVFVPETAVISTLLVSVTDFSSPAFTV